VIRPLAAILLALFAASAAAPAHSQPAAQSDITAISVNAALPNGADDKDPSLHGTPDPEDIGKTLSHGCIRLTNWDALDLAAMARPGTVVKFEDEDSSVAPLARAVSGGQAPQREPTSRQQRRD
jgi:hypothetical protein